MANKWPNVEKATGVAYFTHFYLIYVSETFDINARHTHVNGKVGEKWKNGILISLIDDTRCGVSQFISRESMILKKIGWNLEKIKLFHSR